MGGSTETKSQSPVVDAVDEFDLDIRVSMPNVGVPMMDGWTTYTTCHATCEGCGCATSDSGSCAGCG